MAKVGAVIKGCGVNNDGQFFYKIDMAASPSQALQDESVVVDLDSSESNITSEIKQTVANRLTDCDPSLPISANDVIVTGKPR